jgi:hypothetical protein
MEQTNIDKLSRLKEFIDFYSKLISKILNNAPEVKDINNVEAFIKYLFLQRFCQNSKAVLKLLEIFENEFYFKIPISIILRTCMSDFLTYYYFRKIVKDNSPDIEKINNKILRYLVSNLHFVKHELDKRVNAGEIKSTELIEVWKNMRLKYPILFDKTSNKLIEQDETNFKTIYNILKNDKDLEWAANAYTYYEYYSKFEHIGILTFETQEIHKINEDLDVNRILLSIVLLSEGTISIIKSMPIKHDYDNELIELDRLGKNL